MINLPHGTLVTRSPAVPWSYSNRNLRAVLVARSRRPDFLVAMVLETRAAVNKHTGLAPQSNAAVRVSSLRPSPRVQEVVVDPILLR